MSKFFRALFISAVATGAAAAVLKVVKPEPEKSPTRPLPTRPSTGPLVDADAMTAEQRDLLMQEMETMS